MVAVNSSAMDKRVQIMQPSAGQDATSGDALPPQLFTKAWASIRPMSGSERYAAGQFVDKASTIISMRYQAGITSAMTVLFEGTTYVIEYILDVDTAHVQLNLYTYVEQST